MSSAANSFIEWEKTLLQINENNFDEIALQMFRFQALSNEIYKAYLSHLKVDITKIQSIHQIPFLPIGFFKSHTIKTKEWQSQRIYKSSGTTDAVRSTHHLWDESLYLHHAVINFEKQFRSLQEYHVLALLPSYDTGYSSLVAMARHFVARSNSESSGFFLNDFDRLIALIKTLRNSARKTLLLGVSHALLDLVEKGRFNFPELTVMETGGMKGRKEEITREELHQKLKAGFGVHSICSEYGMTELCSQAYSKANGLFECANTMKVVVKEVTDPFCTASLTGIINIIDLANFHSCAFIETQDLGRVTDRGFEVLGRADNSEARGCNLLIA